MAAWSSFAVCLLYCGYTEQVFGAGCGGPPPPPPARAWQPTGAGRRVGKNRRQVYRHSIMGNCVSDIQRHKYLGMKPQIQALSLEYVTKSRVSSEDELENKKKTSVTVLSHLSYTRPS
ncbi:hypothetical protein VZT92_026856 [Zoarces viviparus]|uniref:Uncharacterized protein n=1 Tax=Zoarces viviparus TaxID=48416 RepID=A0AAW1DUW2_ZOAVI